MGNDGITIFYLQFADDTMIFCDVDIRQIGYLRCILRCFEVVSGLNIKSEMFQVGEVREIENLAWVLGCKIGTLPSLYLGMPLGVNFKSEVVWNRTIEMIPGRLDSWKAAIKRP